MDKYQEQPHLLDPHLGKHRFWWFNIRWSGRLMCIAGTCVLSAEGVRWNVPRALSFFFFFLSAGWFYRPVIMNSFEFRYRSWLCAGVSKLLSACSYWKNTSFLICVLVSYVWIAVIFLVIVLQGHMLYKGPILPAQQLMRSSVISIM